MKARSHSFYVSGLTIGSGFLCTLGMWICVNNSVKCLPYLQFVICLFNASINLETFINFLCDLSI